MKAPKKLKRLIPEHVLNHIRRSIEGQPSMGFLKMLKKLKRAVKNKDRNKIRAIKEQILQSVESVGSDLVDQKKRLKQLPYGRRSSAASLRRLFSKLKSKAAAKLSKTAYPVSDQIVDQQTVKPKSIRQNSIQKLDQKRVSEKAFSKSEPSTHQSKHQSPAFISKSDSKQDVSDTIFVQDQSTLSDDPPIRTHQAQAASVSIDEEMKSDDPVIEGVDQVDAAIQSENKDETLTPIDQTLEGSSKQEKRSTKQSSQAHFKRAESLIEAQKTQGSLVDIKDKDDFVDEGEYET